MKSLQRSGLLSLMATVFSIKHLNTCAAITVNGWNIKTLVKRKKKYKEQLDTLQQDLRSSSRKRTIPKAQVPLPLKIPRVDQTNNIQHQTSLPVTVTNHHNQEIPPAQHPSSASISRDLLQYQQLPYTMLPLTQTAPSSSTSMYGIRFDNLFDNLPKKRLRTCKQCGSNTCPGRTEEGDVNNKKIKI